MILLDVILSGKWNCCKEIYYEAAKRDAAIGMATVYRMVSTLEEIGVFSRCYRYSLPDRPLRGGTGRGLDGLDTEQYIWQRRHARSGA